MIWGRRNPLDDPAVAVWDAVQGGTSAASGGFDEADVAMVTSFLALDAPPAPSARFVDQLGKQLEELQTPARRTESSKRQSGSRPNIGGQSKFVRADLAPGWPRRRSLAWGALPLLAALIAFSAVVLYWDGPQPSEPAAIPAASLPQPTMETMAELDLSPASWGITAGTNWDHMESCSLTLDPGESFTTDTPWYTDIDGPLLITVLSGQLTVQPGGPAFFYSAKPPHTAESVAAGQTVVLGPNDSIIYSAADAVTGSNPGTEPALGFYGLVGKTYPPIPGDNTLPKDVSLSNIYGNFQMPPLPTEGVTVSLLRIELAPFDLFVLDIDKNWRYLPVFGPDPYPMTGVSLINGRVSEWSPNVDSLRISFPSQLRYLSPGPYTLFNLGEETVDFYFLVVEPFPDPATPAA